MSDIMLSFKEGDTTYMNKEQLREICPLAFAEAPTNPDVSKRYLFVNTETIVDDLDKLGWKPVQAAQRKSRGCLLYTSPSPRDATLSRMPSSA